MNEDRYVIRNPGGETLASGFSTFTADEASRRCAELNAQVVENNPYDAAFYTAHRIDPVPTVFETRVEKLERLVDEAAVLGLYKRWFHVSGLARELRDSREEGQ